MADQLDNYTRGLGGPASASAWGAFLDPSWRWRVVRGRGVLFNNIPAKSCGQLPNRALRARAGAVFLTTLSFLCCCSAFVVQAWAGDAARRALASPVRPAAGENQPPDQTQALLDRPCPGSAWPGVGYHALAGSWFLAGLDCSAGVLRGPGWRAPWHPRAACMGLPITSDRNALGAEQPPRCSLLPGSVSASASGCCSGCTALLSCLRRLLSRPSYSDAGAFRLPNPPALGDRDGREGMRRKRGPSSATLPRQNSSGCRGVRAGTHRHGSGLTSVGQSAAASWPDSRSNTTFSGQPASRCAPRGRGVVELVDVGDGTASPAPSATGRSRRREAGTLQRSSSSRRGQPAATMPLSATSRSGWRPARNGANWKRRCSPPGAPQTPQGCLPSPPKPVH